MKKLGAYLFIAVLFSSCISKKKFIGMQSQYDESILNYERVKAERDICQSDMAKLKQQLNTKIDKCEEEKRLLKVDVDNQKEKNAELQNQIAFLKENNTNLLGRLSDLSVVSKTGAENIKKSLETLNTQGKYIQNLNSKMRSKDSVNLALVMNLKRSLNDFNDDDVKVEVKKGVVYISLSDKMLFKSGKADVNKDAEVVLGKIAKVVNDHNDLDILVEGHTDNVPISNSCVKDNWDLSVMRATSVVRLLQEKYSVAPSRMTAGGRSEYVPKSDNTSKEGKNINRRTEIIILPKLDQFFKLLEQPK